MINDHRKRTKKFKIFSLAEPAGYAELKTHKKGKKDISTLYFDEYLSFLCGPCAL
jgi:hypothetical protein